MRTRVRALIVGGVLVAAVAASSAFPANAAPSTKAASGTLISVCLTIRPNAPLCIAV